MKLIIDIDEESYRKILEDPFLNDGIYASVKNGTPLPKTYDVSQLMYDIYMEGVNMTGEYQGCWVRFKDIEKVIDKYIRGER